MDTPPSEAIGQSEAFLEFQERLSRVAKVDRPVLLLGERGVGKELAASRIHYLSSRWQEPFVTLNCAALPPGLIEAELFGHERGAFTGAVSRRTGRFEAAHNGSLFLDEIGTVPLEVQEKVLRAVEYGAFERVGSSAPIQVDVRIVAATNADLPQMADEGRFKRDLLDRLSFEVLFVPPLRERREDILLLANHFAVRMARELKWIDIPEFSEEAAEALERYPWPGNIRELKNVVERAVYRSENPVIREITFDPFQSPYAAKGGERGTTVYAEVISDQEPATWNLEEAVRRVQVDLVRKALVKTRFNQKKAASLLGLTYDQFRGLYRKHRDGE